MGRFGVPKNFTDAGPAGHWRWGYVLPWIIVTIAIIAALAAAAAPSLVVLNDTARANAAAATLRQLSAAINSFESSVRSGNGVTKNNFPGQLSELATQVTQSNHTSCWTTVMTSIDSTTWLSAGPFITFYVPPDGLQTPIGRIRDSIPDRGPNTSDSIWIEIPGVTSGDARLLDQVVDGAANGTVDTVRYHTPVNDTTTVRFRVTPQQLGKC